MKILYISPENTVGLLSIWQKIHQMKGNQCDFVTMYPSKQKFDNGICLNLPWISTRDRYISLRNKYYKISRGPLGDQQPTRGSIYNKNNILEAVYFPVRDILWSRKIEKAVEDYGLLDYDCYHFEWGMDFYRSCAFAEKVKSMGKPIIASYHGQDIRTRGVFKKMDRLADINITSEIDLLDSYDKLTHLCLPYDVKQHNPNTSVSDKIRICHAPTNRYYKGSDIIIPACEKLAAENNNIEFTIMENMSYSDVMNEKKNCDIIVDQVGDRGGWGYGMSSVESMSMGLCSATQINDNAKKEIPNHPFIAINKDNIYNKLYEIVNDAEKLSQYKQQSYEWVTKNHSLESVGSKLYKLYDNIS